MPIELSAAQARLQRLWKAVESGIFAFYIAMVVASMATPVSPAEKFVATLTLAAGVGIRITHVYSIGRRACNPRWPLMSVGGGNSQPENDVVKSCWRDLRWQIARVGGILMFALTAASAPFLGSNVVAAAGAAGMFAAASALGDRKFAVPTRDSEGPA